MPGKLHFTEAEKAQLSRIMRAAHARAGTGNRRKKSGTKDGRSTKQAKARDRRTARREPRRRDGEFE